jgi:hypothetical protein
VAGEPASPKSLAQETADTEPVTLVVHSAKDCPVCKVWRESPSGLETARQIAKDWPELKLVFVERPSLNGSEAESLYPSDLQHLYQARRERYQLSPAVPLFELVRQGKSYRAARAFKAGRRAQLLRFEPSKNLRVGSTESAA